jgi:hypothetical protein
MWAGHVTISARTNEEQLLPNLLNHHHPKSSAMVRVSSLQSIVMQMEIDTDIGPI